MKKVGKKEIEAVLKLSKEKRFQYFVKWVADSESAWGLWDDGWALMGDDGGEQFLPLWPTREYAELCKTGDWSHLQAKEMPLEELLTEQAEKLKKAGIGPAVFPTPQGNAVITTVDSLCSALKKELSDWYE